MTIGNPLQDCLSKSASAYALGAVDVVVEIPTRSASAKKSKGTALMDSTTTRTSCPRSLRMVAINGKPSLGNLTLLNTCRPGALGSTRVIRTGVPPQSAGSIATHPRPAQSDPHL